MPGRVVRDASEGFLSVLGYAREEIVGRSTRDLGIWIDPEDRAAVLRELNAAGRVHDREARLRTKAGSVRLLSWSARILELDGARTMLSAAVDITERRDAEGHFGSIPGSYQLEKRYLHRGGWCTRA